MPRVTRPKKLTPGATEKQVITAVLDAARCFGLKLERQNTGQLFNPSGQAVRFGVPGDPDYRCNIPSGPNRNRKLWVEMKRESFDPRKLRGEKAAHFARQIDRMRQLIDEGDIAFWISSGPDAARVFQRVFETATLRFGFDDDGFPWMEKGE